jgi:hypothetical protein
MVSATLVALGGARAAVSWVPLAPEVGDAGLWLWGADRCGTVATSPTKGNPTDDEPDRFARFGRHAGGIGVFDARRAATFLTTPATTTNATGFGIRRLPRARWVSPE